MTGSVSTRSLPADVPLSRPQSLVVQSMEKIDPVPLKPIQTIEVQPSGTSTPTGQDLSRVSTATAVTSSTAPVLSEQYPDGGYGWVIVGACSVI